MEDIDIEKVQEKMAEFGNDLDKLLDKHVTDDVNYGMLIQETMAFAVFYAYLNHEEPDQVDFALRKLKQLSLKEREKIDKAIREGSS
tara:strand:+ start:2293 stop:2553 length:261 start_codon:yes stop_codon:yes gene_type:complete